MKSLNAKRAYSDLKINASLPVLLVSLRIGLILRVKKNPNIHDLLDIPK